MLRALQRERLPDDVLALLLDGRRHAHVLEAGRGARQLREDLVQALALGLRHQQGDEEGAAGSDHGEDEEGAAPVEGVLHVRVELGDGEGHKPVGATGHRRGRALDAGREHLPDDAPGQRAEAEREHDDEQGHGQQRQPGELQRAPALRHVEVGAQRGEAHRHDAARQQQQHAAPGAVGQHRGHEGGQDLYDADDDGALVRRQRDARACEDLASVEEDGVDAGQLLGGHQPQGHHHALDGGAGLEQVPDAGFGLGRFHDRVPDGGHLLADVILGAAKPLQGGARALRLAPTEQEHGGLGHGPEERGVDNGQGHVDVGQVHGVAQQAEHEAHQDADRDLQLEEGAQRAADGRLGHLGHVHAGGHRHHADGHAAQRAAQQQARHGAGDGLEQPGRHHRRGQQQQRALPAQPVGRHAGHHAPATGAEHDNGADP